MQKQMRSIQKLLGSLLATIPLTLAIAAGPDHGPVSNTLTAFYDEDSKHLWNRLNETLFVRTAQNGARFSHDEVDILFWLNTKHLLEGQSHERAVAVLDEFLEADRDLVRDPRKRAILQRDLWQLFDWAAKTPQQWESASALTRARTVLREKLAQAIRHVGLKLEEIATVPDNYAAAEGDPSLNGFPRGIDSGRDWIRVGIQGEELSAEAHARSFGGRSVFSIYFRHPEGRNAGLEYLQRLRSFQPMWVDTRLNPAIPQFPAKSQWALVRRMCVIDHQGKIVPTRIIESIQVRTYRDIPQTTNTSLASQRRVIEGQDFAEFAMTRTPGLRLRAIGDGERGFPFVHFLGKGIDLFEYEGKGLPTGIEILKSCGSCHAGFATGIGSVNTFTRFFSVERPMQTTQLVEIAPEVDAQATILWKSGQSDWGLLTGLWRRN